VTDLFDAGDEPVQRGGCAGFVFLVLTRILICDAATRREGSIRLASVA